MDKFKDIPHTKEDLKDLGSYLKANDLIDERDLWFAGFPYNEGSGQNAIAGNFFWGNRHLKVIAVKGEDIYYLHNAKDHFAVNLYGKTTDKFIIVVRRMILHPTIKINNSKDKRISLQINHNKAQVFEFRELVK